MNDFVLLAKGLLTFQRKNTNTSRTVVQSDFQDRYLFEKDRITVMQGAMFSFLWLMLLFGFYLKRNDPPLQVIIYRWCVHFLSNDCVSLPRIAC